MRRLPNSWTDNFLARLGYRRKRTRRLPQRTRRSSFEALEMRAMLSGTSFEDIEINEESSESQPRYVLVSQFRADQRPSNQFVVRTEYGGDGSPRAVVSLLDGLTTADDTLHTLNIELQQDGYVLESQEVLIDIESDAFRRQFLRDRLDRANAEAVAETAGNIEIWVGLIDTTGEFEDLKALDDEQAKTETLDRLEAIARSIGGNPTEDIGAVARRSIYSALEVQADEIATAKLAAVTDEAPKVDAESVQSLGRTALLLAEQIATDLDSSDPQLKSATENVRDAILQSVDSYYTIFTGLGQNQLVHHENEGWRELAFGFLEAGSFDLSPQLSIQLGTYQAMVQGTTTRGRAPLKSTAAFNLTRDTYIIPGEDPEGEYGSSTTLVVASSSGSPTSIALLSTDTTASLTDHIGKFPNEATLTLNAVGSFPASATHRVSAYYKTWYVSGTTLINEHSFDQAAYSAVQSGFRTWTGNTFSGDSQTNGLYEANITEPVQRALLLGDSNADGAVTVSDSFGKALGDIEAFYLAIRNWDEYVQQYGGVLQTGAIDDLLFRNDANWDGEVDSDDIADFFLRLNTGRANYNLDTATSSSTNPTDGLDYSVWSQNYGRVATRFSQGDGDFNGFINDADYTIWQTATKTSHGAPTVPQLLFRIESIAGTNSVSYASSEHTTLQKPSMELTFDEVAPSISKFIGPGGSNGKLKVEYRVPQADIADETPVALKLYQRIYTTSGIVDQEIETDNPEEITDGITASSTPHVWSFTPDAIPNPTGNYSLVVKMFVDNEIVSERYLSGGIFKDAGGNWHIWGGAGNDQILIEETDIVISGDFSPNSTIPGGTQNTFYIRTLGGYDSIGANIDRIATAWLSGGDQNDRYEVSGGVAGIGNDSALQIKDDSGLDKLDFSALMDGDFVGLNLESTAPQDVVTSGSFEIEVSLLDTPIEVVTGSMSSGLVIGPGYDDQPIVVDTLADLPIGLGVPDNMGLRKALALADAISGANTIEFAPSLFATGPQTLTLQDIGGPTSSPDTLILASLVTLVGPGTSLLSISGNDQARILQVNSSVAATIRDLTLVDGRLTGSTNHGAGILNHGDLWVDSVDFVGNESGGSGGAIYSSNTAKLRITESEFINNKAVTSGGAIYSNAIVTDGLVIERSAFLGNEANAAGAIQLNGNNNDGTATITNSTFSANRAVAGEGGAIKNASNSPILTIANSTIAYNTATSSGGALSMHNNTDNRFLLHHTIVAHNESTGNTNEQFNRSVNDASSYNLLGYGGTFSLSANGLNNIQLASGISAGLTPLGDYGGPTRTYVPLPDSPAVNAGNSSAVAGTGGIPAFDQRGSNHGRVHGVLDIGAVEANVVQTTSSGPLNVYGTNAGDGIQVGINTAGQAVIALDTVGGYEFPVNLSSAASRTINAGSGADIVSIAAAVTQSMTVHGEAGNDVLIAGGGTVELYGGDGDDTLIGSAGADLLDGGDGNDILEGLQGADEILGGEGDDYLAGRAGNDDLDGGAGNDIQYGNEGDDSFADDAGADTFFTEGDTDPPESDNLPPVFEWIGNPQQSLDEEDEIEPFRVKAYAGERLYLDVMAYDPEGTAITYTVKTTENELTDGDDGPLWNSDLGFFQWNRTPPLPNGETESHTFTMYGTDGEGHVTEREFVIDTENRNRSPVIIGYSVPSLSELIELSELFEGTILGTTQVGLENAFIHQQYDVMGSMTYFDHHRLGLSDEGRHTAFVKISAYDPDGDELSFGNPLGEGEWSLVGDSEFEGVYSAIYQRPLDEVLDILTELGQTWTYEVDWDYDSYEELESSVFPRNPFTETFTVEVTDEFGGSAETNIHVAFTDGQGRKDSDAVPDTYLDADITPSVLFDETIVVASPETSIDLWEGGEGSKYLHEYYLDVTQPSHGVVQGRLTSTGVWVELSDGLIVNHLVNPGYSPYSDFRYIPYASFFLIGKDEFKYQRILTGVDPLDAYAVSPEVITSNVATITFLSTIIELSVESPPHYDDPTCECECTCYVGPSSSSNSNSGRGSSAMHIPHVGTGYFRDPVEPAVATVDISVPEGMEPLTLTPTVHNVDFRFLDPEDDELVLGESEITLSSGDIYPGETATAFVPVTNHQLMSGYYLVSANLSGHVAHSNLALTALIQQDDIGFGYGWNLAGTERLIANPTDPGGSRIYWLRADGIILNFNELNSIASGDSDANLIEWHAGTSEFTLTDKFGNVSVFDEQGRLTTRTDPYGNDTTYTYRSNDSGTADDFKPISVHTSIDDHATTFNYNGGRVDKIIDFAERETLLSYSLDGFLSSITFVDPDDSNNTITTTFETDSIGRLVSITDAEDKTTAFTYDTDNSSSPNGKTNVVTTTYEDGSQTTQVFPQVSAYHRHFVGAIRAEIAASGGVHPMFHKATLSGTFTVPSRTGRFVDELGRVTTYEVDSHGHMAKQIAPDGIVTEFERNSAGQVIRQTILSSNALDANVLDETLYTFNAQFNLTDISFFDGSNEHWTYDAFSRVTSHTDELGRQTIYTYTDFSGKPGATEQVTIRQVVGTQESESSDLDDLFTDLFFYSYGLLQFEVIRRRDYNGTQQNSYVTEYDYTSGDRWLETVRRGSDNPAVSGIFVIDPVTVTVEDFDAFGNATRIEDEAGRDTLYEYDWLDRLTQVTSPDPDGNTSSAVYNPVTQFEYTATGRVKKQIRTSVQNPAAGTLVFGPEIVTKYDYDNRHRLVDVYDNFDDYLLDADHTRTQFEYDAAGNLTAVVDPLGRITTYEYDLVNRPIRVTEPDPDDGGSLTSPVSYLAYDALGRLTAETDPRGSITRYEYDEHHNLRRVLAALGATTEYSYDAAGQLTAATDAESRTTGYLYDDAGRLTTVLPPGQSTTPLTYQYDTAGNLRLATDQLGRVTESQYDDLLRLTKVISPHPTAADTAGSETGRPVTSFEYWADGQIKKVTEKLTASTSRETSYVYDGAGRLATVTLPQVWNFDTSGNVTPQWTYLYDEFGRTTQVTDPRGNHTKYEYDNLHRLTKTVGAHPTNPSATGETGRPVTSYVYDAASQMVSLTEKLSDSSTRTTHYDYDDLGRVTRVVEPNPTTGAEWTSGTDPTPTNGNPFTRYQYDVAGNLTAMLVPESYSSSWTFATTSYGYDALGRRVSETDANGDTVRYGFDRVANMTSLTDPPTPTTPAGNTTTWQYDALDRITKETNALGYARSFVYDAVGNLTQRTDRNGRVMKYAFDRLDRRTTEEWYANAADPSADRTLSFTYDLAGRLLSTSDPDHASTYEFDALDRMTSQAQTIAGLTPSVSFAGVFDASGNRRSLGGQIGSTNDFLNNYTYDGLDRLTSLTQQDVGGGNAVADKRVDFAYDLAGQLDWIKRYKDVAGGGGNAVASSDLTFDKAGRLTTIDHRVGQTPGSGAQLAGYGYTWNQRHELKTLDFLPSAYDAEDVTYSYDLRGQLTGANYTSQTDETYAYDDNGNRATVTNVNGANQDYDTIGDNRLSDDDTFTYTYDNEGNRLTRTRISSAAADDKTVEYTWDHRNRLVKVTFKNNAGTITKTVDNAYDADNQWIKRVVDPDGATGSAAIQQTVFIHEGGQIALQFDKTGSGDLTVGNLSHRYLWANAVDQLLADEQVILSETLWALTDHLGSVRDVVDNNATVRLHRAFDSYGNTTASTYYNASGVSVGAGTTGAIEESVRWTGKVFDTWSGLQNNLNRWYDPLTGGFTSHDPIESDVNSYRYGGNTPTTYVDPTGLANVWNIWTWDIQAPSSTWGHFFNPFAEENIAFFGGMAQGGGTSAMSAGRMVQELAYQNLDAICSTGEIVSGGSYRHHDWSSTAQALSTGRIPTYQYYSDLKNQVFTFGVYGQSKAFLEYQSGSITAEDASGQLGGTGILQLGGAYIMKNAPRPGRGPTSPMPRTGRFGPAPVPTLREIAPYLSDDTFVHFGPRPVHGNNLNSGTSCFRLGDIKGLTPSQVETLIGDLANGGQPGGASYMHPLLVAPGDANRTPLPYGYPGFEYRPIKPSRIGPPVYTRPTQ